MFKHKPMYVALSQARALAAEYPVGDPFGGPAYGQREFIGLAIGAISAFSGGAALFGAASLSFGAALTAGAMLVGGTLSVVGRLTGDANLAKLGGTINLVGGLYGGIDALIGGSALSEIASSVSSFMGGGESAAATAATPELAGPPTEAGMMGPPTEQAAELIGSASPAPAPVVDAVAKAPAGGVAADGPILPRGDMAAPDNIASAINAGSAPADTLGASAQSAPAVSAQGAVGPMSATGPVDAAGNPVPSGIPADAQNQGDGWYSHNGQMFDSRNLGGAPVQPGSLFTGGDAVAYGSNTGMIDSISRIGSWIEKNPSLATLGGNFLKGLMADQGLSGKKARAEIEFYLAKGDEASANAAAKRYATDLAQQNYANVNSPATIGSWTGAGGAFTGTMRPQGMINNPIATPR